MNSLAKLPLLSWKNGFSAVAIVAVAVPRPAIVERESLLQIRPPVGFGDWGLRS